MGMTDHDGRTIGARLPEVLARFTDRIRFGSVGPENPWTETLRFHHDRAAGTLAGRAMESWWVSSGLAPPPAVEVPGLTRVCGDPSIVHHAMPGELHILVLDGCRCLNHAILEWAHYSGKAAAGGIVVVCETTPRRQDYSGYSGHGPIDRPESYSSGRAALVLLGLLPTPPPGSCWELLDDSHAPNVGWGGVTIFRRR